jgi:restriction system protein
MTKQDLPTSDKLEKAVLEAITDLGGKANNREILNWTVRSLAISDEQLGIMRSGNRSEVEYRLAWARTRASKKGLIHRSGPSQWSLGSTK